MDSTSSQSPSPTDSNILPRYRHAAPSGPWPWMDFSNVDISTATNHVPESVCSAEARDMTWSGYPQNAFRNWTSDQVERSQMFIKCSKNQSTIYWMDVSWQDNGKFSPSNITESRISMMAAADRDEFWKELQGEVRHILSPVQQFGCNVGFAARKYPSAIIVCG
jgi:hypothetical protein